MSEVITAIILLLVLWLAVWSFGTIALTIYGNSKHHRNSR
jgi:hypothetical protein